ncbi:unnamed protein product [Gadus morhua 'NCC']
MRNRNQTSVSELGLGAAGDSVGGGTARQRLQTPTRERADGSAWLVVGGVTEQAEKDGQEALNGWEENRTPRGGSSGQDGGRGREEGLRRCGVSGAVKQLKTASRQPLNALRHGERTKEQTLSPPITTLRCTSY